MIRFNVNVDPEDIVYTGDNCKLKINSGNFQNGQLLLTNSDISWKNLESDECFMIPWEKVTVQAITQEPQRCVYFMIDVVWPGEEARNGNSNGDSHTDEHDHSGGEDENEDAASEESLAEITEFHIVPARPEEVDEIYYLMTKFPAEAPMEDDSDEDAFLDGEHIDQMNLGDDDDEDRFQDP